MEKELSFAYGCYICRKSAMSDFPICHSFYTITTSLTNTQKQLCGDCYKKYFSPLLSPNYYKLDYTLSNHDIQRNQRG